MWGELLQGLGAAGEGALEGYTWAKDYQQRDRSIDSRAEIARLNGEIKTLIASMNEGGRNDRHATPSGSVLAQQEGANARTEANNFTRTNVAEMLEGGRNARHATPSGNTLATQDGATERTQMNITARDLWNKMRDNTTRRGQDISQGNAQMRDETTRRGQDFGSETTRRGQELRRSTTGGSSANGRGAFGGLDAASQAIADGIDPNEAAADLGARSGDVELTPQPAAAADRAAVIGQMRAALDAVKNAKTPTAKAAALQKLKDLRAQVP